MLESISIKSILDIIFPSKETLALQSPQLRIHTKASLNSDYPINVLIDYHEVQELIHRIKTNDEFMYADNLTELFQAGFGKVVQKELEKAVLERGFEDKEINIGTLNKQKTAQNIIVTFVPPDPIRSMNKDFCLARFLANKSVSGYQSSKSLSESKLQPIVNISINIKMEQLLTKSISTQKQSYLNRDERIVNLSNEAGSRSIFEIKKCFGFGNFVNALENGLFNFWQKEGVKEECREIVTQNFGNKKNLENNPDLIVLIDDIVTTGATLDACYKVLAREFGDTKIICVALASNE